LLGSSLSAYSLKALTTTRHDRRDFRLAKPIPKNNRVIMMRIKLLMLEKSLERKYAEYVRYTAPIIIVKFVA
jgi:hypothetical protein